MSGKKQPHKYDKHIKSFRRIKLDNLRNQSTKSTPLVSNSSTFTGKSHFFITDVYTSVPFHQLSNSSKLCTLCIGPLYTILFTPQRKPHT